MSAGAAPSPNPDVAEREVYIVNYDEYILAGNAMSFDQPVDCLAAAIHERKGLGECNRPSLESRGYDDVEPGGTHSINRLLNGAGLIERNSRQRSKPIQHVKPHIVPRTFIRDTRVTEANDQPFGASHASLG